MIDQLNESIAASASPSPAVLLALAFRSVFVGVRQPAARACSRWWPRARFLWADGGGLEFASVVALLVVFGLGIDALIHFLNRLRLEERPGDAPEWPSGARACWSARPSS